MRLLCLQSLLAMYGACQTCEQFTKVEGYPGTGPVVAPAQQNSPVLLKYQWALPCHHGPVSQVATTWIPARLSPVLLPGTYA
jgi:hypothetical protein